MPVESVSTFPATGGEIPWTYSHFSDPYIALARASAVTSTIKLATGITLVPERNPLLLAKEISVLDLHSGGRFIFGIGTGWLKEETELMGGNFARRWTQTREALDVMKLCWTQEETEYHGEFFDFPPIRSFQNHSSNRALRSISAVPRRKSWNASSRTPTADCRTESHEEIAGERKELDTLAQDAGQPSEIGITVYGQPADKALLDALHEAGAERVTMRPEWVETDNEMCAQLEKTAAAVL